MDIGDTGTTVNVVAGVAVLLGVLGVLVPVLPGLVLCWLGVLFWALLGEAGNGRWLVLGLATLVAVAGTLVKYLWPGKRLKNIGVPTSSMVAGGVLLIIGFVLGIWLAERMRLGAGQAWPSTREALAAVGLAMLVEFAAALGIAVVWVFGLLAT
jgi:uncharacterized protein YqgC (DUF456 family)